jgi:hypothetical protein
MGLWQDFNTADSPTLFDEDGEQVAINTGGRAHYVNVFWQNLSLEGGGDLGGPRFWVNTAALPTGFAQGDTVEYDDITYEVTHRQPDGHGLEVVTLWDYG